MFNFKVAYSIHFSLSLSEESVKTLSIKLFLCGSHHEQICFCVCSSSTVVIYYFIKYTQS